MTWSRRLLAVAAAALAGAVAPVGAPASAAPAPLLAIAVDDGARQVEAGQAMHYKITLRNHGTAAVPLTVTVDAPAALTGLAPDSSGTVAGHTVRWQVTVPARGESELLVAGGVAGTVPADLTRLALVACATLPDGKAPIVCGTDQDGVARPAPAPARPAWWRWPLVGLAGLQVLTVPGTLLWRRRRVPAFASLPLGA